MSHYVHNGTDFVPVGVLLGQKARPPHATTRTFIDAAIYARLVLTSLTLNGVFRTQPLTTS